MNRNIRHATLGAVLAGGSLLAGSGFAMDELAQGYMLAAGAAHDGAKDHEGKCGEGKCGIEKVDADKDGRISQAEFIAVHPDKAEQFAKMDANQDGFVDKADRELAGKQHRDDWFESADSNNDGSLSKAEYDAAHAKRNGEGHKHGRWGRGAPPAKDAAAQ